MSAGTPDRIKAEEGRCKTDALLAVKPALKSYAIAHQGRFMLYGSAARGSMRYRSDVDILLDFSSDQRRAARNFVEYVCLEQRLETNIMLLAWCEDEFLDHIRPDLVSLP